MGGLDEIQVLARRGGNKTVSKGDTSDKSDLI